MLKDAKVPFAINMGPENLKDPGFIGDIRAMLKKYSLSGKQLRIEVLETVSASDITHYKKIFQDLEKLGCRFDVDDWGTARSSHEKVTTLLLALKHGKEMSLKIDQKFVLGIMSHGRIATLGMLTVKDCNDAIGCALTSVKDSVTIDLLNTFKSRINDPKINGTKLFEITKNFQEELVGYAVMDTGMSEFSEKLKTMIVNTDTVTSTIDTAKTHGLSGVIAE